MFQTRKITTEMRADALVSAIRALGDRRLRITAGHVEHIRRSARR